MKRACIQFQYVLLSLIWLALDVATVFLNLSAMSWTTAHFEVYISGVFMVIFLAGFIGTLIVGFGEAPAPLCCRGYFTTDS